jgi:hypothetical protein
MPRKSILIVCAVLYMLGAIVSAWQVIAHTQASTHAIEQILVCYNMKNEGAKSLKEFSDDHPLLGLFVSSPIKHELELPSLNQADHALYTEVTRDLKTVRLESSAAAWWSWFLLCFSFTYVVVIIALERSFTARGTLFALTAVSLFCFVIGILAPAMVIWTTPIIPLESGNLEFVLQHEVRGIAAIIWELLTSGHWIIGGFLLLFSILTPLTKASLTFFVTSSTAKDLNYMIGQLLHAIGKWSMADVFVAGVLLALYALKAQEATKSIPCLGLYYFIGYCILSMTTTELLVHSGVVAGNAPEKAEHRLGPGILIGLGAGLLCFILASSLYTYQQYTMNTEEKITATGSPQKLNNADLVLPAHQ